MKNLVKIIYLIFSAIFITYLLLPGYNFPFPPNDSIQSQEPADTEAPFRRAYFTNYTRSEVLSHYSSQLIKSSLLKVPLPTYRLNYPPEEAQTIIRDQTRSTFLEEITHPLRESVFINGFQAKNEKDTILIDDKIWLEKITVRFVPSSVYFRLVVGLSVLFLIPLIINSWSLTLILLKKELSQKWNSR
ncbi:hypothetical protein A2715_05120 [Candidatus Woesebacteria bacterium RIFCSPHIGHO2_01_FULL_39_32]|uniref:Uncharacterized protein n=1 Tax=Candidatus Woesebacteria bacterium RIFCSPLOWO2_01_FULL_39_25 TaxID=1802521 RepID=A0A1F8BLU3_9BACT|nr:MAG: hypothetical protein A2124_05125 [Candidatus Woesebacteria bacterium GWB1_37_5]OGM25399.1 MAG: hypothetical protein A2715_05120 [Candidatus Woesebacteria bacterium RIFCSPHIGHO2_01_FULL_39_32]OGM38505.1 MAG: hypothetical protein A3F01_04080 [Candidatus Woesebacteria bacterium RIFCSPHIGHO2_12_FULL_38_11]OGM64930.1 MAG: hypothetical protein A2893_04730 [Candidatus Woesebacteria bacterium RIFCSPLOWO2_01_FULL_39_25]